VVSSGTILPIFIEIGSYLTDKEQKNKLAVFLDMVYMSTPTMRNFKRKLVPNFATFLKIRDILSKI